MFRSMDVAESAALNITRSGGNFGEMCEPIAREVGAADAPLRAASILKDWFADEIIADLKVASDEAPRD